MIRTLWIVVGCGLTVYASFRVMLLLMVLVADWRCRRLGHRRDGDRCGRCGRPWRLIEFEAVLPVVKGRRR